MMRSGMVTIGLAAAGGVLLIAGCESPRIPRTGLSANHVELASQGYARSARWTAADVRLALVHMVRDYGWKQTEGRELATPAASRTRDSVTQVWRTYRTADGEIVTVHWIDEAGHGARVFVSSEVPGDALVEAVTADLSARIEREKDRLPPLPPSPRLLPRTSAQ